MPSAKPIGRATLSGYELRWHKVSRKDGSGKCNALLSEDKHSEVQGVLFEIAEKEKPGLDAHEGPGYGYNEHNVTVVFDGERLQAVTYLADRAYIDDSLKPLTWYKSFVLAGAREHGLTSAYVDRISSQLATEDSNKQREREERAKISK